VTPSLSVLMPALNEEATISRVVEAVLARPEVQEIVLVDDGSQDGTWGLMQAFAEREPARVKAYRHERNQGKGAAVRTAVAQATGDYVLIQDCDLEYNPSDYPSLLEPVTEGRAKVVYGSRTFSSHTAYSFWFVMGNKLVTLMTNLLFNCYLSDMETGYKLLPREAMLSLRLRARGFDLEPEITAKLLKRGFRIYEVPVHYAARTREEGKKLTVKHGFQALWILFRERLLR
jgi:glycosyltransferase involved in cell wall biosynthesis